MYPLLSSAEWGLQSQICNDFLHCELMIAGDTGECFGETEKWWISDAMNVCCHFVEGKLLQLTEQNVDD